MVHLFELAQAVAILDRIAHPSIVDRALRKAEISRDLLRTGTGFAPYSAEAVLLEDVARALGERHVGALVGNDFDYSSYGAYGDYVLGARDLVSALTRGRRALPILHPGSDVSLSRDGDHLILGFGSGIPSVLGHRHLDEGSVFVLAHVCRHFLGPDWQPDWIELTTRETPDSSALEELAGAPLRMGADRAAFAIGLHALAAPNPAPPAPAKIVTLRDLPALMGAAPPKTMEDMVRETMRLQLASGDLSEDSVARRLALGRRSIQRALREEGTSFREVKARFAKDRACALLSDTDLTIEAIGQTVGYAEPKSFRRAFGAWTGVSPSDYRDAVRGARRT